MTRGVDLARDARERAGGMRRASVVRPHWRGSGGPRRRGCLTRPVAAAKDMNETDVARDPWHGRSPRDPMKQDGGMSRDGCG